MADRAVKVAVSLPLREYKRVEQVRKRLHLTRSAAIGEALRCWFSAGQRQEMIRAYVEGYRRMPESAGECQTFEAMASETLAGEDWDK